MGKMPIGAGNIPMILLGNSIIGNIKEDLRLIKFTKSQVSMAEIKDDQYNTVLNNVQN